MLRALVIGLSLLHLGPGLAFALLAFGCDTPSPLLGALCSKGEIKAFGLLTLGAWVVLGGGWLAWHRLGRARSRATSPARDDA